MCHNDNCHSAQVSGLRPTWERVKYLQIPFHIMTTSIVRSSSWCDDRPATLNVNKLAPSYCISLTHLNIVCFAKVSILVLNITPHLFLSTTSLLVHAAFIPTSYTVVPSFRFIYVAPESYYGVRYLRPVAWAFMTSIASVSIPYALIPSFCT